MLSRRDFLKTAAVAGSGLAAMSLVGCSSSSSSESASTSSSSESTSSSESSSTSESSSSETAESTSSGERITISVMGVDWGYGPVSDSTMELWWEDLFDVNLDIEWVNYEDYSTKLNTLIATGSQPDVIQVKTVDNLYYYPIFTEAIDAGEYVDMTSYLIDSGFADNNSVMSGWDDAFWSQATYKDGIYIIPRNRTELATQSGLMVRRDLMVKYGYEDEPTTMDELKDWLIGLSQAATEGEGYNIYALEFYGEDFMSTKIEAFATAFTGQTDWGVDENGDYVYLQFNDKYIDFLNWMKDLYDAGCIDPEFALGNEANSRFKAGNSVLFLNAWYNFNQSEDLTTNKIFDSGTPDTYQTWELLPVEGPEAITITPNSSDIGSAIAISASCSEEKIQKILQVFCATEEEYPGYDDVLSYGVEGLHFTLLEDGTRDTTGYEDARTEGYVGAWNQIFLKTDDDQITSKFMRDGASRSSDENIERATEVKETLTNYLEENPSVAYAIGNLYSETYSNQWSTLTDDVNTMCTLYVMGEITESDWTEFVADIVNSDTYKAIQAEFKEAAEA